MACITSHMYIINVITVSVHECLFIHRVLATENIDCNMTGREVFMILRVNVQDEVVHSQLNQIIIIIILLIIIIIIIIMIMAKEQYIKGHDRMCAQLHCNIYIRK